ncbi:sensor histidine kinase [Tessaracoccus terricola]
MRNSEAEDGAALRSLRLGQHALFALLLAVAVVRLVSESRLPLHGAVAVAVTVVWYVLGVRFARPSRRLHGAVWLSVLIALWLGLTLVSVEFSWLAFPLFLLVMNALPLTWALLSVTLMASVVVLAQVWAPGGNPVAEIIGPVVGAVVAVGIGLGYQQILAESRERGRLVAELQAVQHDLAIAQREAGAVAERSRLARDIHDTLAQGFSSILLLARAGGSRAADEETGLLFTQIGQTAAENLAEARAVVGALTPDALGEAPLPEVLGRLLERLSEQTGISTDLRVEGQPVAVPTAVEVALLRLAQGALANVRTHSRATRVAVTVTHTGSDLLLDVVDDGVGFDPASIGNRPGRSGFGLRSMTERLREIGGTVTVESAPGEGTAVAAAVPLGGPR